MALAAAGAAVEVISLHHGRIRGMNLTEPTRTVKVDRHVKEVGPEDYDALFIPGGFVGAGFRAAEQRRDTPGFAVAGVSGYEYLSN